MGIIYEFKDCNIYFDDEKIPSINLSIEEGEKIALIMPRDIYDVAFLYFLFFLKNDYDGYAAYKDKPINQLTEEEINVIRLKQAHVSLHLPMINNLKLIENVYLPALYKTNVSEDELFQKAYEILKIFQLEDKFKYLPSYLTNYEKKCGLIARALMSDADLVYYSHIFDDTEKEKRSDLFELIEKFHSKKKERTTIITFRQKSHVLENFRFDKIISFK